MTNIAIPAEGDRRIPARFYVPSGPRQPKPPLIVYFHGGGFFSGDLDTHDVIRLGSADARTGERLVAIGISKPGALYALPAPDNGPHVPVWSGSSRKRGWSFAGPFGR